MKILLIDNYDSFTYNLYHYISNFKKNIDVVRNDKIDGKTILRKRYDKIVISPGPGNPNQAWLGLPGPGEITILSYLFLKIVLPSILSFLTTSIFFLKFEM